MSWSIDYEQSWGLHFHRVELFALLSFLDQLIPWEKSCSDLLGDPSCFSFLHISVPNLIQKGSLPRINVTQYADDWRSIYRSCLFGFLMLLLRLNMGSHFPTIVGFLWLVFVLVFVLDRVLVFPVFFSYWIFLFAFFYHPFRVFAYVYIHEVIFLRLSELLFLRLTFLLLLMLLIDLLEFLSLFP